MADTAFADTAMGGGSLATSWQPRSAWDGFAQPGRFGAGGDAGVTITIPAHRGSAMLIVSDGTRADFEAAMVAAYGIVPPSSPRRETGGGIELIWAGPERWLARSLDRGLARDLESRLGGLAAVTDQGDARAALRIEGPYARAVLAKGCPIDLHPRAFRSGDVALTAVAYMSMHMWQLNETPVYELAVFRSMAGSFWSWLSASAAESGANVVYET